MSVNYDPDRRRFVVRWREDGRNRTRRFESEHEAADFDATLTRSPVGRTPTPPEAAAPGSRDSRVSIGGRGDGIYPHRTDQGVRWRFVFRQSDGTSSSRRGYASRGAAVAARRRLLESIERFIRTLLAALGVLREV